MKLRLPVEVLHAGSLWGNLLLACLMAEKVSCNIKVDVTMSKWNWMMILHWHTFLYLVTLVGQSSSLNLMSWDLSTQS